MGSGVSTAKHKPISAGRRKSTGNLDKFANGTDQNDNVPTSAPSKIDLNYQSNRKAPERPRLTPSKNDPNTPTRSNYKPSPNNEHNVKQSATRIDILQNHPLPRPPFKRKNQIFQIHSDDITLLDNHTKALPEYLLTGTRRELVDYLIEDTKNDVQKLRAIFIWLASVDIQQLAPNSTPPEDSPMDDLLKIKFKMLVHAQVLERYCRIANLYCVLVTGMNKSAAYELGSPVSRKHMVGYWNAIYVDDEWRLCDAFWASTCISVDAAKARSKKWRIMETDASYESMTDNELVEHELRKMDKPSSISKYNESLAEEEDKQLWNHHEVNEFYFLTDPDKLIYTHFPDNPDYQLLPKPVSVDTFEELPYLRDPFFKMGLYETSESLKTCSVLTGTGEFSFELGIPRIRSKRMQFKYVFYSSHSNKSQEKSNKKMLDEYVYFEKSSERLLYTIKCPQAGMYRLNIFGKEFADKKIDKGKNTMMSLITAYIIESTQIVEVAPLPDAPGDGWGPIDLFSNWLIPITHKSGLVFTERDGTIEIRFEMKRRMEIFVRFLSRVFDESTLSRYVVRRIELINGKRILTINIRVPKKGDYSFRIYARTPGYSREISVEQLDNVCNYLVRCLYQIDYSRPFPLVTNGILSKTFLSEILDLVSLGFEPMSHRDCRILCNNGTETLVFRLPKELSLLVNMQHTNLKTSYLEKFVKRKSRDIFIFEFPANGEFALNFYIQRKKKDSTDIFNIFNYLVLSTGQTSANDNKFKSYTHDSLETSSMIAERMVATTDEFKIELEAESEDNSLMLAGELIREAAMSDNDEDQVKIEKNPNSQNAVIKVNVPTEGIYTLNVYRYTTEGFLDPLKKYEIIRVLPLILNDSTSARITENHLKTPAISESPTRSVSKQNKKRRNRKVQVDESLVNKSIPIMVDHSTMMSDEAIELLVPLVKDKLQFKESDRKLKQREKLKVSDAIIDDEITPVNSSKRSPGKNQGISPKELLSTQLRQGLLEAMADADKENIRKGIEDFKTHNLTDSQNLLPKATRLLKMLDARDNLGAAIITRDPKVIRKALNEANNYYGANQAFDIQIDYSSGYLERLLRIEKITNFVTNLDHMDIAELRSYTRPPPPVYDIMMATFKLIEADEGELNEWRDVQIALMRMGRESVKYRVANFDFENCSLDTAMRAKKDYLKYNTIEIRDVSMAAAAFHLWGLGICEEVQKRYK